MFLAMLYKTKPVLVQFKLMLPLTSVIVYVLFKCDLHRSTTMTDRKRIKQTVRYKHDMK